MCKYTAGLSIRPIIPWIWKIVHDFIMHCSTGPFWIFSPKNYLQYQAFFIKWRLNHQRILSLEKSTIFATIKFSLPLSMAPRIENFTENIKDRYDSNYLAILIWSHYSRHKTILNHKNSFLGGPWPPLE